MTGSDDRRQRLARQLAEPWNRLEQERQLRYERRDGWYSGFMWGVLAGWVVCVGALIAVVAVVVWS